jgi:hypothetical protein
MRQTKKIRISVDIVQAIVDHLDDLGESTIEEYVEAVLRSHLQESGHLNAYTEDEEKEVERRLRDLGYLD